MRSLTAALAVLLGCPPRRAAAADVDVLLVFKGSATDPDGDLTTWGGEPCGNGWWDADLGWFGVTCCADYGLSGLDCYGGNAQHVTRINLYACPIAANISVLSELTELQYLELGQTDVYGPLTPLRELQQLVLLDLFDTAVSGNATALRSAIPALAAGPEALFRFSYCTWHDTCAYRLRDGATHLAGTDDDACCQPPPGPRVCDLLADFNIDAVAGIDAVAHATDGTAPNFLMRGLTQGVSYVDGDSVTLEALSRALDFGAFTCASGYTFDVSLTIQCTVAGGAATLSSQPCVPVCATLADLDKDAVRGCYEVTNATNGVGGFHNFTMAASTDTGAFMFSHGRQISDLSMELSVVGSFTCQHGFQIDTSTSFHCTEPGGEAFLTKQPCTPVLQDPVSQLFAEQRDCLALIDFQSSGEPWNTGTGEEGWTSGGAMWMENDGRWTEARWSGGCQDFRNDCRAGLMSGRLNCDWNSTSPAKEFWVEYCEAAADSGAINMTMRGVCPQRTAPECLLTCGHCEPCDVEMLDAELGPCGDGWDDPEEGWMGVTCDEKRGRVVQLSIVNKAISANVGALGGLSALTHLDLRNCSRLGGDVANLTQLPVLSTLSLTGTAVYSGVDALALGYRFCPVVNTQCSRCDDYQFNNRMCATGYAVLSRNSLNERRTGSCNGPGVGNDDCACCIGSTSKRAVGHVPSGSGDWAGRPLSSLGAPLHYGSCIDRTCADRDADGFDDDDCPDAPPGEPAFDNRRMKRIRCDDADHCATTCPICWQTERDNELASRIALKTAGALRAGRTVLRTVELGCVLVMFSVGWRGQER